MGKELKVWCAGIHTINEEQIKIALSNGLERPLVCARLRSGKSIEEAITIPKGTRGKSRPAIVGQYTDKDIEEAERNGIKARMFRGRIYNLHWDVERAKTEPPHEARCKGEKKGQRGTKINEGE